MTLPSITRSFQNKSNVNRHSTNNLKSLNFMRTESKSNHYDDRLKIVLVYLTITIALASMAINYWAPIEKFLLSLL
jgi:hypothetical protein